jgi:hypothetical protein
MFTNEHPCQRGVAHLNHYRLPNPLPKLGLGCPKLLAIPAYHQRSSFFLFLLLFLFCRAFGGGVLQVPTPCRLGAAWPYAYDPLKTKRKVSSVPRGGSLKAEAALVFRKPIREAVDLTNGNARLVGFSFFCRPSTLRRDLTTCERDDSVRRAGRMGRRLCESNRLPVSNCGNCKTST